MQQEVGFEITVQRVDELFVVSGTQSCDNKTLRFTACKQGRTVCTWQKTSLGNDRANGCRVTTIDTLACLNNVTTQDASLKALHCGTKVRIGKLLFCKSVFDHCASIVDGCRALLLVCDRKCCAHVFFASSCNSGGQLGIVSRLEIKRLFCAIFCQINDQVDHRLDLLVRKVHSTKHFSFRQLICFGFNHHYGVFCACNNEVKPLLWVQTQVLHVVNGWVQRVFAIHKANARTGDWAHERSARNRQRRRCRDHSERVWIIVEIVGQNSTHHQNFVFEAWDEQWADRTVDQTCCQCFFFGRTCFALEETTGDFARSIIFFLVMHGQRKEILTRLLFLGKSHSRHNGCFTKSGDDAAICLTRNFARFECQRIIAPLN